MSLNKIQKNNIKEKLFNTLRDKFKNYKPETNSMPFHTRLLGKDRMALFSFIHSLNTNFGTAIFENLVIEIGKERFKKVDKQVKTENIITYEAKKVIDDIIDNLRSVKIKPDKNKEINMIKKVCREGETKEIKPTKVDIYLEGFDNDIYLIDLKTAKPNKGEFQNYKRTLLEWTAVTLYKNYKSKVYSMIAIPYNPYAPKPYERWTLAGMLDLDNELKVAEEFWDFIGGENSYSDILLCFEEVGIAMRKEIDEYFSKFKEV